MSNIIVVLGPDRVGKSTIVQALNTEQPGAVLHFDGPKPWHNSPIDQYFEKIDHIENQYEWVYCDRGGVEVCFYEKYRRNVEISVDWAYMFEQKLEEQFNSIKFVLVKKDWEWSKPHHELEIDQLYPNSTEFWKSLQLQSRFFEHRTYYKCIENYFDYYSNYTPIVVTENYSISECVEMIFSTKSSKKVTQYWHS